MYKEVMDRFFLLKTQSAPTRPIEISSFKKVLCRNFFFGGSQAKKQLSEELLTSRWLLKEHQNTSTDLEEHYNNC